VRLDTIIRKGELDFEYAMLFRQLNLPPGQLDGLKTLIVERNQAIYDATQLAKEEGLVFASTAEEKAVATSALGDIDGQIATLLGADGFRNFREHVDLKFYRQVAEMARRNAPSFSDPTDDERVRELARQLRQVAPDFEEQVYRNNGWHFEPPPAVREMLAALRSDGTPSPLLMESPSFALNRRMQEIARDALLDGRITMDQLSGSVAGEYRAALERRAKASTP
jgi:hypothetical protein